MAKTSEMITGLTEGQYANLQEQRPTREPNPVLGQSKQVLETEALSWSAKAKSLRVVDVESCVNASHLLKSIKGLELEIDHWFAPHVEAAMETKRRAEAARKGLTDEQARMKAPLMEAEGIVKRGLLAWEAAEEGRRLAEERRLQEAARLEAERVTLEAAAAMELEAAATGDAELQQEAEAILAQPIDTPVVSVERSVPKVAGVTYRDQWKAHPDIDVAALAAAVATGEAPVTFLTPNVTAINQFARATQGAQSVAGVRFFNDRQIAARG